MRGESQTEVLRCLAGGSCLTLDELDGALALDRRSIVNAVGRLSLRGYAERVERGCYQLTAQGREASRSGEKIKSGPKASLTGVKRPLPDTLRQRAWNAMRMSGAFSVGDLVMAAARPHEIEPDNNLLKWLRALCRAGLVIELPVRARGTALTSNGYKRFRLMKDTGPVAPVHRATSRTVFDHNTREELPCSPR